MAWIDSDDPNVTVEIRVLPALRNTLSNRPMWVRVGVVLLVLLYAAGVGLVAGLTEPLYAAVLAALPFAAGFVLFMESRLQLAPIFILLAAAYIPFSLPTGTGSRLVISLVLACGFVFLWFFRMFVVERDLHLKRSPANLPVLGFATATVISLGWSLLFRDPLVYAPGSFIFVQAASAAIMVVSPLLLLFNLQFVREEKVIRWMVWVMISVGVLGYVANLFPALPVNTRGLTAMWIMAFAVALVLVYKPLNWIMRLVLIVVAGLWMYWGFIKNLSWVAGWLPGFVAVGVILFFKSKKLLLGLMLVAAVYIFYNIGIFDQWFGAETVTSGDTRMAAWLMNWEFTRQHLLFGMGPAGYTVYYMTFIPLNAMATHSNYIDVVAQTGIVGFVFYIGIFVVLVWRGLVVMHRLKGTGSFLEAVAVAALGGTAGCIVIMAFGDWLLPFAYTQTITGFSYTVYSWVMMGLILSLDAMTAPKEKESPV